MACGGASDLGKSAPLAHRATRAGRRRILGWALGAGAGAALAANVDALLTLFGVPPAGGGEGQLQAFALLGRTAPALIFAGAGLALAATVELRRATTGTQAPRRGERARLRTAWALLGLAVWGVVSSAGIP